MNDWIHTRRGVTLVEGTLPMIAKGIKRLADALDLEKEVEWELEVTQDMTSPGPGWEPWEITKDDEIVWKRRKQ